MTAESNSTNRLRGAAVAAGLFTAGTAAVWAAAAGTAWAAGVAGGVAAVTAAAGLCLLPGWLVFAAAGRYGTAAHAPALMAVGVLLRMAAVAGGSIVVGLLLPGLNVKAFLAGLLLFYLATLVMETGLLLTVVRRAGSPAAPPAG